MKPARPMPAKCVCMNNADAPSTHRGAAHLTTCPHSTLADDTGGYAEKATRHQQQRRQAMRGTTPRPKRITPIITLGD